MADVDSDRAYRRCISEAKPDGVRPLGAEVTESDVLESIPSVVEGGESQALLKRHWDT